MRMFILGVIGLLSIGFLWWFFQPEPTITNYPSSGTEIIAFGDSLIEGVGATAGNDLVSKLERSIDQPIVNLGVSGDTTADGLTRLEEVTVRDAKVVLLLLGGNDSIRNVPMQETRNNLAIMIEEIHATGAVVLLLGVRGGLLSDGYKDMYQELAKEYQTAFVPDVLDGVFGRTNLMADPIHPNNGGYQKIADRITPVLQSII